jgi:hypothetical protein
MCDGLYQVTTKHLCAGFVVQGGHIVECAPILRKRLSYWMIQAVLVDSLVLPSRLGVRDAGVKVPH